MHLELPESEEVAITPGSLVPGVPLADLSMGQLDILEKLHYMVHQNI